MSTEDHQVVNEEGDKVEILPIEPVDGPDTFTVGRNDAPNEVIEAFGRHLLFMGIRVQAHYGEDGADVVVKWDEAAASNSLDPQTEE